MEIIIEWGVVMIILLIIGCLLHKNNKDFKNYEAHKNESNTNPTYSIQVYEKQIKYYEEQNEKLYKAYTECRNGIYLDSMHNNYRKIDNYTKRIELLK